MHLAFVLYSSSLCHSLIRSEIYSAKKYRAQNQLEQFNLSTVVPTSKPLLLNWLE